MPVFIFSGRGKNLKSFAAALPANIPSGFSSFLGYMIREAYRFSAPGILDSIFFTQSRDFGYICLYQIHRVSFLTNRRPCTYIWISTNILLQWGGRGKSDISERSVKAFRLLFPSVFNLRLGFLVVTPKTTAQTAQPQHGYPVSVVCCACRCLARR